MGLDLRSNGEFIAEQERLVASLSERREDLGRRVLEAIGRVPRHRFVPPQLRAVAYEDRALPIGSGQTISAPHMVAIMARVLDPRPGDKVFEVGTGSGYHAAVLAEMVAPNGFVTTVEYVAELAEKARSVLTDAGYGERVRVLAGDGAKGDPEQAPFQRISIAAATPKVPEPLLEQLDEGGVLVAPVGSREAVLTRIERTPEGLQTTEHGLCVFVPLTGKHGEG